ncbi:MAG TPA: hypothetical protein VKS78_15780, partial [Roseiarcus sp.]|nr:hypothetical protein [Roseiarcus sp.]
MPARKPVKRSPAGAFFAWPAAALLAGWLAAADQPALVRGHPGSGTPSAFDYLVLASLADSPQLHAMAGYRPSASRRSEPLPAQP